MNTSPYPEPDPEGAPVLRDAAGQDLEEYLVEYLCREQIGADEIKELLIAEALQAGDGRRGTAGHP